ncbi:copper-binding protein [Azospirillum agricola]|uniref:copper-binding protein n=1 Tax=Azospirillum agricola TaxID=1720247 RepID=UPI000A0F1E3A|nr:copper-binding protein [Azospirillum agricola]SMH61555.1 Cu(I)/Ag(I) efflux system protein CusF [Azospirillum lipoferum]
MRRSLTLIAAVSLAAGLVSAAQAQMHNHGSAPAPVQTAAERSTSTTGTVNGVDARKRVINLTHGPIPALGWPAMTMAFGVAMSVDLGAVKPGDTVVFTVGKDARGTYLVDSMKPAR